MSEKHAAEQEQRFVALWTEHGPRVMAYALRHLDSDTAQDVVSETFLVAWRRLASVPDNPLPWLLVVARNTISNLRRSNHRQERVTADLERFRQVAEPAAAAGVLATERAAVLAQLAALTPTEREALLLAWDGLTVADSVVGCQQSRPFGWEGP
ncbi:RNA polymerase sigma factor [Micromonospora sp. SL1-18]|uniref:RNA polymerase sigma factor n=1 Tax=Micromonospora sp. SL1-18 TaxID=3399128 RepID=UPI003A4E4F48